MNNAKTQNQEVMTISKKEYLSLKKLQFCASELSKGINKEIALKTLIKTAIKLNK
jgi:hypothetical protein